MLIHAEELAGPFLLDYPVNLGAVRALVHYLLIICFGSLHKQADRSIGHRHVFHLLRSLEYLFSPLLHLANSISQLLLLVLLALALCFGRFLPLLILGFFRIGFAPDHPSQLPFQVLSLELMKLIGFIQHSLFDQFEHVDVLLRYVSPDTEAVTLQAH